MDIRELVGKYGYSEFRCPKCGSSKFGSSNVYATNNDMVRHCHGSRGCSFTWPQKDDEKYLYTVIVVLKKDLEKLIGPVPTEW